MFKLRLSTKGYLILFLTAITIWGGLQRPDFSRVILTSSVTILIAVILDLLISYFKFRMVILPSSAVITGIIVTLVIAPHQHIIYYVIAATLGILSKHLLKVEARHIFNPAGFGLLVTAIILPVSLGWWGQVNNWFLLIVGGFIVYKVKRFPVALSYLLTFGILLMVYSLFNRGGLFDYLPAINLFFVLVMLIEPKTSPLDVLQGWLFGIIVAVSGFLFYLFLPQYDFALSGLAMGDLSSVFLRKIRKK